MTALLVLAVIYLFILLARPVPGRAEARIRQAAQSLRGKS